ncbi:CPBP family intramembrane metalloprotease [Zobellia sp. KMM 6746]|uniref:CPBP family intramembrane metalloprotease n=1 Tax=Zobellia barbeyronii TaxID=2748009 RepID=A0ABS5WGX4_9FLAO|nr:CPBP family intramembrane metalloprotease [Zobellia barbeyronii]
MFKFFQSLYQFANDPSEKGISVERKKVLYDFFYGWATCMLTLLVVAVIGAFISMIVQEQIFKQPQSFLRFKSSLSNAYLVILVGPLVEELCYRFYLKINRLTISISLFFTVYFLLSLYARSWFYDFHNETFIIRVVASFFLVSLLNLRLGSVINKLKGINLKYVLWFSCCTFALIHLLNFVPLTFYQKIFFPVLVLVQFVYGVVFGFLRLKHGFIWGLLLHIFINATGFAYGYWYHA